jgi:DNA-binding NarL/FixJ family response regulator
VADIPYAIPIGVPHARAQNGGRAEALQVDRRMHPDVSRTSSQSLTLQYGGNCEDSRMQILVVDDHPLVREGLKHLLAGLDNETSVVEASSADAALQAISGRADLDLVLLDLNLPGRDGLSLLADLGREAPDLPVVMLSGEQDPALMRAALDAGAAGFIPKSTLSQVILPALKLVLAGGVYVPPEMLPGRAPEPAAGGAPELTPRRREVLAQIAAGKSNKEIAAALQLSEPTVKGHVVAVFRALRVRTRTQAIAAATRLGLIS